MAFLIFIIQKTRYLQKKLEQWNSDVVHIRNMY